MFSTVCYDRVSLRLVLQSGGRAVSYSISEEAPGNPRLATVGLKHHDIDDEDATGLAQRVVYVSPGGAGRAKLAGDGADLAEPSPAFARSIREDPPRRQREGEIAEDEGCDRPGLEQHQPRQRVRGFETSLAKRRREAVQDDILRTHNLRHDISGKETVRPSSTIHLIRVLSREWTNQDPV